MTMPSSNFVYHLGVSAAMSDDGASLSAGATLHKLTTLLPVDFMATSPTGGPASVSAVLKSGADTIPVCTTSCFPGIWLNAASPGPTPAIVTPLTPASNIVMVVTTSIPPVFAPCGSLEREKGCTVSVPVTFTVRNTGGTVMLTGIFFNGTVSSGSWDVGTYTGPPDRATTTPFSTAATSATVRPSSMRTHKPIEKNTETKTEGGVDKSR